MLSAIASGTSSQSRTPAVSKHLVPLGWRVRPVDVARRWIPHWYVGRLVHDGWPRRAVTL